MKRADSAGNEKEGGSEKRWMVVALSLAVIVVAVSCYLWFAADKLSASFIQNAAGAGSHGGTVQNTDSAAPAVSAAASPQNAGTTPAVNAHGYPYASPVPGKPGFFISPYAPDSGYVDLRGFDSGAEVKDPYSGKMFVVP
jgi:hypothetical protein